MRETAAVTYAGLDIGSSTVRCVIGISNPDNPANLDIIGHGSAPNLGMRKGIVVHADDVAEAVVAAVSEAERVSGVRVQNVTVNVNGSHILGMNSRGVIAISTANREINNEDRLRVEEAATIVQIPPNREIIQVFAKNYRLDGQDNIKDPVGMQGVRLEVDTHIVTAATPNLRNLDMVLERARLNANHHTVSSLAAAEAVLNRQQKESGTLLLDIGAGTTNLVVVEDGEIQHVAIIPVGGQFITNDLAIGLKTDLDIAEAVKIQHGALASAANKRTKVSVQIDGNLHQFNAPEIEMITEARVDELLEMVDKELKKIQRSRKLPGGVVLVGGSSKIAGMADFTKEKLQLAARMGHLQPLGGIVDSVQDPSYAVAVGLTLLDMLLIPAGNDHRGQANASAFGLIDGLFKKFRRR